jgi:hypothetical protein
MRYESKRYSTAAVSGLIIATLLVLGGILVRSTTAPERGGSVVADTIVAAPLRGSLR